MNTDSFTIYQMLAFTELKCQKAPKIPLKKIALMFLSRNYNLVT